MKNLIYMTVVLLYLIACKSTTAQKETKTQQNDVAVTEKKNGWDSSYGGVDKSYDNELLVMRDLIAPRFQTLTFNDQVTGKAMIYKLFIPKDYNPAKSYPLVLFMADASTVDKGPEAPLKQGYGGIIWATDDSQAEHPSFVLVPSYVGPGFVVNDNWEVNDEVEMTLRLLEHTVKSYNIDRSRLYTTGQSMGGMMSFYFNSKYPGLFAASLFVGSQWDVNVLKPLARMKFFYIVSAADSKASVGMKDLGQMFQKMGVSYGSTEFSAKLPQSAQDTLVNSLIAEGYPINFIQFSKGTVVPEGSSGPGGEHMYSFDYAYKLKGVRDWLFKQSK